MTQIAISIQIYIKAPEAKTMITLNGNTLFIIYNFSNYYD